MLYNPRTIFAVSLLIFFSFISCSRKQEIKIGFSANLTGRNSELGISARNGVRLAISEFNEQGGLNGSRITLLVKDDMSNPDTALHSDKELISEGVIAIIGHLISATARLSVPYVNSTNTVMISPTVSSELYSRQDDNFIRVIPSNIYQGELLARTALKRGIENVYILYDSSNSDYTTELVAHFLKLYTAGGGQIIKTVPFNSSRKVNFTSIAKDIVAKKSSAVLSITAALDNALLCQQLSKLNSDIPVLAGLWSLTDDLISAGGKSTERMLIAGVIDRDSKLFKKFKAKYMGVFGAEPTFSSIYAYEATMVILTSLKKTDNVLVQNLKEVILKTKRFNGVLESFSLDRYGDTDRKYYLFTVRNNSFVRISE